MQNWTLFDEFFYDNGFDDDDDDVDDDDDDVDDDDDSPVALAT